MKPEKTESEELPINDLFGEAAKLPDVNPEIEDVMLEEQASDPFNDSGEEREQFSGDEEGEKFNPEIHAIDKDGFPKKKRDGTFAKKRGRKSGAQAKAVSSKEDIKYENVQLVVGAKIIVGSIDSAMSALLAVRATNDEQAMLCDAWIAYLETLEINELPAWALLAMSNLMIYAPKMTQPEPLTRIDKLRFGLSHIWGKMFRRKNSGEVKEKTEATKQPEQESAKVGND